MANWPNWNANNPMTTWSNYPNTVSHNGYSGQYHMPYAPQQNVQRGMNNLLRVTGPESARAYPIGIDSNVVLFDADNPIFYLVSSDDSGFKTMRTFRFVEETPVETAAEPVKESPADFATKDDMNALEGKLAKIEKMLEGLVS